MGFFANLLGSANPVESMPVDDLKIMEIKLNRKIEGLQQDAREIEAEIRLLFERAKATKAKSEELSLARRIKTASQKKEMKLAAQLQLEKELRAVSNIVILKEHEADLRSAGVWESLRNVEPETLESWLVAKKLDSQNRDTLVDSVVEMTSAVMETGMEYEEDLDEILEAIRAVKDETLAPEAAALQVERKDLE